MRERIRKCLEWFAIKIATHSNEHVCATRDVFQARAEKTYSELLPYFQTEGELALFFAELINASRHFSFKSRGIYPIEGK